MLSVLHRKLLRRFRPPRFVTAASLDVAGRTLQTPNFEGVMSDISEPWMVDLLQALLPRKRGYFTLA
jgi:hypothetical protein